MFFSITYAFSIASSKFVMLPTYIAYLTFVGITFLKQTKIIRSLIYLSSSIFCNMLLNGMIKSQIFSLFFKWICVNYVSKVWYAIGWEYRAMKASSISSKLVIELVNKDRYQSYTRPTIVCMKTLTTTSSSITEWMPQMAKNWSKFFS